MRPAEARRCGSELAAQARTLPAPIDGVPDTNAC
jgi:hypothetical protein